MKKKHTVLLVEDNVYDRECIKKFVNWDKLGLSVIDSATNGVSGLEKCIELNPDIVLSDISMHKMDGLEMIKQIEEHGLSPKVIVMSCHDKFSYAHAAIELNVSKYILKPIDIADLEGALSQAIATIQLERQSIFDRKRLEEKVAESLPTLRSDFFQNIIYSREIEKSFFDERSKFLNLTFGSNNVVVVFQIDHCKNEDISSTPPLFSNTYLLKVIIEELFSCEGYTCICGDRSVCAIFSGRWSDETAFLDDQIEAFTILKDVATKQLGFPVTIGVGHLVPLPNMLNKSFESARIVIQEKFYHHRGSGGKIILASNLFIPEENPIVPSFEEVRNKLNEVMEKDESNDVNHLIRYFFSDERTLTEAYTKETCYLIVLSLQLYINDVNVSFEDIFGENISVWDKLTRFDSITNIRNWIKNIIVATLQYIQSSSSSKNGAIAMKIKSIIDRDFATVKTIGDIAKQVYTSTGHANFLFKQKIGMTIGDYLFECRMEAAKKLLRDPQYLVYEVMGMIGYISKSYFGAVFKEYTGMSPREYRDSHCIVSKL